MKYSLVLHIFFQLQLPLFNFFFLTFLRYFLQPVLTVFFIFQCGIDHRKTGKFLIFLLQFFQVLQYSFNLFFSNFDCLFNSKNSHFKFTDLLFFLSLSCQSPNKLCIFSFVSPSCKNSLSKTAIPAKVYSLLQLFIFKNISKYPLYRVF